MTGVIKKLFSKMAIEKNMLMMRVCVQLIFIMCVNARTEINESENLLFNEIQYSNDTLNTIAGDICDFFSYENQDACMENWLSPPQLIQEQPAALRITNLDDTHIHYEIAPSKHSQAVIMVSDDELARAVHYLDPDYAFPSGKIRLNPSLNYTFWTVALFENGTHSHWLLGPRLPARNTNETEAKLVETNPNYTIKTEAKRVETNRNYTIKIDRSYGDMHNCSCSNVTFTWSIYNDSDTNFTLLNSCNGDIDEHSITRKSDEMEIKYSTAVPLGSKECQFEVEGYYGKGRLLYDIEPQGVKEITLYAVPSGAGWNIRVGWTPPDHTPDLYRVVLRAGDKEITRNVSGNASEFTFRGVMDNGKSLYNVSVCAFKGPACMHELVRGIFPPEEIASSSVPVLASLLVVLVLATVLVSCVAWRRRRRHSKLKHLYREEVAEKLSEKFFPEFIFDPPMTEDSWEIRPEKLQLHEVIGEGAFGVVRRGTLAPGKPVAVKMLKDYPSRDEVRSFRAETELMKSVGAHPHVVSLVGCCSGRRPLIVAEYCSRGDLLSYLRCSWDVMVSKRNAKYCNNNLETSNYRNDLFKSKSQEHSKLVVNKMYDLNGVCDVELTFVDLLSFCRQIAMGMEFLASNRVVHRDLAARNVLVTSDRTLKIADFGLSRDIYQENQYKQKGNGKMPVKWMALESLTHRIYTTMSDVWSFGVVVWEVVTVGASPYPDVPAARLPRLLRAGYRMPRPNACSKQLYDLMVSCWHCRPRARPTFSELHAALDAMLHCACAEQYLALDLDAADLKPSEPRGIYMRLLEFARGKRRRGSGSASPPARTHNHYSSPPAPNNSNKPLY